MIGQLSQCCCGISLRTGTLIIGVLYLIASSISCVGIIVAIYNHFGTPIPVRHDYKDLWSMGPGEIDVMAKMIAIIQLALCLLETVVNIVLIIGAAKRNASLVVPWLVLNIVLFIFSLLGLCVVVMFGFIYMGEFIFIVYIIVLAVVYIYFAVNTYILKVVFSFYEKAKKSL